MAGPLTASYIFRPLSLLLIKSTSVISKRIAKKETVYPLTNCQKPFELTEDAEIDNEKDIL